MDIDRKALDVLDEIQSLVGGGGPYPVQNRAKAQIAIINAMRLAQASALESAAENAPSGLGAHAWKYLRYEAAKCRRQAEGGGDE